jgi:uncharacterized protein (DUF2342 family)
MRQRLGGTSYRNAMPGVRTTPCALSVSQQSEAGCTAYALFQDVSTRRTTDFAPSRGHAEHPCSDSSRIRERLRRLAQKKPTCSAFASTIIPPSDRVCRNASARQRGYACRHVHLSRELLFGMASPLASASVSRGARCRLGSPNALEQLLG